MKLNKQMIKDLINEVVSEPSMLLEEPLIKESSFNRIKDKVDNTDISFVVMSADRHEKSRNENDVKWGFHGGGLVRNRRHLVW